MYWSKEAGIKLVANRISASSKLSPGRVISYANSVVVSPTTGKVYFTSSGDIPPPYNRGEYDTKAASGMIALTVRSLLLSHAPGFYHAIVAHTTTSPVNQSHAEP